MSFRPYKISSLNGRAVRTGIALLLRGIVAAALVLAAALPSHADTYELLQNGHFETGTLSGWHVANLLGSYAPGSFSIATNMNDPFLTPPSPSTPISQLPSVGAAHGNFYAVSDSLG